MAIVVIVITIIIINFVTFIVISFIISLDGMVFQLQAFPQLSANYQLLFDYMAQTLETFLYLDYLMRIETFHLNLL